MNEKNIYLSKLSFTTNKKLAEIYCYLEQLDAETSHLDKLPINILLGKISASRGLIIRIKQILTENVEEIPENIGGLLSELIKIISIIPEDTIIGRTELNQKLDEINIKSSELLRIFFDR